MTTLANLLGSASKLVFLFLTLTACFGFLAKILDTKDFMILASMAFSFYFSNKGEPGKPFEGK